MTSIRAWEAPWPLLCLCYIQCFTASDTSCFATSCLCRGRHDSGAVVGGLSSAWSVAWSFTGGGGWLCLPPLRTGWCSITGSRKPPPPRADLAHLVVVGDGRVAQLPFKVQLEGKIQVPLRGEEERGFQRRTEARTEVPQHWSNSRSKM